MGKAQIARAKRAAIKLAQKELVRRGIVGRMATARGAIATPWFAEKFAIARQAANARAPLTNLEDVRKVALDVLERQFSVDLTDIMLTLAWDPAKTNLTIGCYPTPAVVLDIFAKLKIKPENLSGLEV